ncbi:MAG: DeoR/GlpR transcriptional regulator [Clostridia bacterium]|nr:DeoR/GlpR transcriptional regulator [Clostridia bacterium]
MMIGERHRRILEELKKNPEITVRELSILLSVSEPTVRRDFTELHRKGIITKIYGGAILNQGAADREIPFLLRENEKSSVKTEMGAKAAEMVKDGMVVMLDGSTSAYHLVPYLARKKDLIVVTSGAKTAVALAEANIPTFCTGGKMLIHSFSYVGEQAESFVRRINADLLFFSCHGLSDEGQMTERAIEEADLRRAMFGVCKEKILLCDSSKFGKTCFYNMGSVSEIDGIISEKPLPPTVAEMMKRK